MRRMLRSALLLLLPLVVPVGSCLYFVRLTQGTSERVVRATAVN